MCYKHIIIKKASLIRVLRRACLALGICACLGPHAYAGTGPEAGPGLAAASARVSKLVLNGAGIRKQYFRNIYIGALYLDRRCASPEEAIAAPGPKSIQLHILYPEIGKEEVVRSWEEGFRNNLTGEEMAGIEERLGLFASMALDIRRGDDVRFDFTPGGGTTVSINGRRMGTIEGDDFFRALLKVWLGPHPADMRLKMAMLGIG